jgi:hypothetical protein
MSSVRKCDACKKKATRACDCCKKHFCGEKHIKAHERSCFPSTEDLSTEEVEHIEKLAINLKEASLETFCETLNELLQWVRDEHGASEDSEREMERLQDSKRSVFLQAEGLPSFISTLERHHAQLSGTDHFNVMVVLVPLSNINEDALSSIVEIDVCSVIVQCIRTCQLNDVRDRLGYRQMISSMFHQWLVVMPGSTVIRKQLMMSGAIKIIIQWLLEDYSTGGLERDEIKVEQRLMLNKLVKKDALTFLSLFSRHNFLCKTMLIETGGLRAVATIIRENWGEALIRRCCKSLLTNLYCDCQDCRESIFCNLCGCKANFACPCIRLRYCSKECQRKDWKSHKKLCKDIRENTKTKAVNNTFDEYVKEMGTVDTNDDDSQRGIDVVERLRSALSVDDVMHWLLLLSRLPYEEVVRSNGFDAVVRVMIKHVHVAEIQRRGCTVFVIFNRQDDVSHTLDVANAIFEPGGKIIILEAMKKYPYDAKLQGSACNALVGLGSLRTDNKCDVEAARAIIGAMLRHKDDFSIQEGGCGALCSMAADHPENKKELVIAGAAGVVATASETFWDCSPELHDKASSFFSLLWEEGNTEVEVDNLDVVPFSNIES